ncbi:MAG: LysR substrate-binding domain-containing protein [Pseudomonadota bacterium]
MQHNLNLNWLRSFEAAARLLSFTRAGLETGLTQTAISQHIRALEGQLGDKLFVRGTRSLRLTDVGEAYLPTVRRALNSIEMTTNGLFGPRGRSTLVVRASMAFTMWLSPRLEGFLQANPDVGIKLVTAIWNGPATQHPVDIDIVLAAEERAGSHGLRLASERLVPVCSQKDVSAVRAPEDLLKRSAIHIVGFDDHWARYLSAQGLKPDPGAIRVTTDTSTAALEMVASGVGCAVVIERFAQQAIASGWRIALAGSPVELGLSHFIEIGHTRRAAQPGAAAFAAWLREQV